MTCDYHQPDSGHWGAASIDAGIFELGKGTVIVVFGVIVGRVLSIEKLHIL